MSLARTPRAEALASLPGPSLSLPLPTLKSVKLWRPRYRTWKLESENLCHQPRSGKGRWSNVGQTSAHRGLVRGPNFALAERHVAVDAAAFPKIHQR